MNFCRLLNDDLHSTFVDSSEESGKAGQHLDHAEMCRKGSTLKAKDKIGHRREEKMGAVTYKKKSTSELMAAIQLGIGQSVGGLSSKSEQDLHTWDFGAIASVSFPSVGSNLTPAHHHSDFRFKTYAPIAFRYFRELFSIQTDDFLIKLSPDEIVNSHRVGHPKRQRAGPRQIIARLNSVDTKFRILRSSKLFQNNVQTKGISVSEDLTKYRDKLLYLCRQLCRNGELKKAWSSNGKISVMDNSDRVHYIRAE
uniref:Phosphatidylinositol-4-phosphate 5-kinase type-1 alpha n=1 Tax=Magallana gigas TaxID=29159 RepID=K1QI41_MAGGI